MSEAKKARVYDELLKGVYRIDRMSIIFIAAGTVILFGSVWVKEQLSIPDNALYIIIIAACVLFLLGAVSWLVRLYLTQKVATRVLITTIENAARTSKTSQEFRDALKELLGLG